MKRAIVIFAAGMGTRMKSDLPKVLHTIAYKPMLSYVLDVARAMNPAQIVLVLSPYLETYFDEHPGALGDSLDMVTRVVQHPAQGMGHGMQVALPFIQPDIEDVITLCGDVPGIQPQTLQPLLDVESPCCFLGMHAVPPHAYGRMKTKGDYVLRIIEHKEATDDDKRINYVWSGILKIRMDVLRDYLPRLKMSPIAKEYFLTDIPHMMDTDGHMRTTHIAAPNIEEFDGVNDKAALAVMEERAQQRMRMHFLNQGVKMIAPHTVYFAHDTVIEEDAVIHPFVTFGPKVHVGSKSTILSHCHIENSVLGNHVSVGPFVHLRGGNQIADHVSLGNFVEVKKSKLAPRVKAKHLTYIGDADIASKVNIGAGTVVCNYDGEKKHLTRIEDGAFIGAQTTLVAPITIGAGALTAAGSVVTDDVPAHTLVIGRSRQVHKKRKGGS